MWRCNAGRGAATGEQLPAELHLEWSWKLPPLQPAWSEDPRLQFDASYEPIVAAKTMFLASSRNDSVTALDTETGAGRWRFFADSPVRFAPVAH
jgi:glucose dehydrogenase